MKLMSIPDSFKWTSNDHMVTPNNSDEYLKRNELNIRRCIGEAVPTHIIEDIASKATIMLDFEDFVNNYNEKLVDEYLKNKQLTNNFYIYTFLKEQQIENAKQSGAFYTPQCVVYDALKDINTQKDVVHILEPAVGLGAFLPQLSGLFSASSKVYIDAVEINKETIRTLKSALKKIALGEKRLTN